MDKEFIAMRKKGLVYDYGLQKWVKEPVGMYGDPALAQLFRPTKRAADSLKAGEKSAKRKVVKAKVIRPAKSG